MTTRIFGRAALDFNGRNAGVRHPLKDEFADAHVFHEPLRIFFSPYHLEFQVRMIPKRIPIG
jgi:hypothetical protein